METLAEKITDARRRHGLSQTAFADLVRAALPGAKCSQISVCRWEHGHGPNGVYIRAIQAVISNLG